MSLSLKSIAIASLLLVASVPLYAQGKPTTAQNSQSTFDEHPGYGGGPQYVAGSTVFLPSGFQTAQNAQSFQNALERRVQSLENKRTALEVRFGQIEQSYKAGVTTTTELQAVKAEYSNIDSEFKEAQSQLRWVKQLNKLVSFECSGASLAKTLNALSSISGVAVKMEENLKSTALLNMTTARIPLYKVLEAIAAQADVMIDRTDTAIILRRWSSLEISGVKQTFTNVTPWSQSWDEFPFLAPELSQNGQITSTYQQILSSINLKKAQGAVKPPSKLPYGFGGGFGTWQPSEVIVSLRGTSEIVLTEPANYKGKTGYWISVYRANGKSMSLLQKSFVVSARSHPE